MPATRISGACVGCRAKKQKCSGDRSGCAQCAAAGIECVWPEQRKRGPAKGYIEALEQRLHAAESLLLGVLPHVDDLVLQDATVGHQRLSRAASESSGADAEERRASRSSPPTLNKKTGVEYWENFGLDSVINIRRWQQNCQEHSTVLPHSASMRTQSQTQMSGTFPPYRGEDEMRSNAAAATIAGMRHHTTSPGTPNSSSASSMIAVAASSRPIYESSMSPGRNVSISQTTSSSSLPTYLTRSQQQQTSSQGQSMWYPQFQQQPSSNQHPMNLNMNIGIDQNYGYNPQSHTAMDVDASSMTTNLRLPEQPTQQSTHPGGLYQGDFSQNIFW